MKGNTQPAKQPLTLPRIIAWILVIGGIIGFLASCVLMIDKIKLIQDPNFHPICSINPVLSCGSVMKTPQSSAFGFPNAIIGIAGFAIVTTVGMAMLAGAQLKKWFWWGLQAGVVFGVGFVTWLQFQTIYRINAICLYCVVVWCVMIPIFWYVTLYNLRMGHIRLWPKVTNFVQRHHGDILIIWFALIAFAILNHFWYYWSTLV
jgi:uncharacterized membrane protein